MPAFSKPGWETDEDELQRIERERQNAEENLGATRQQRPKFWLDMRKRRVQRGGSRQRPRKVDAL